METICHRYQWSFFYFVTDDGSVGLLRCCLRLKCQI